MGFRARFVGGRVDARGEGKTRGGEIRKKKEERDATNHRVNTCTTDATVLQSLRDIPLFLDAQFIEGVQPRFDRVDVSHFDEDGDSWPTFLFFFLSQRLLLDIREIVFNFQLDHFLRFLYVLLSVDKKKKEILAKNQRRYAN